VAIMTEAEAQAWLTKTVIVFIGQDGEKWLGFKDVDNCVFAPDERGAHYLADEEIVEELTVQQIVDIATGG